MESTWIGLYLLLNQVDKMTKSTFPTISRASNVYCTLKKLVEIITFHYNFPSIFGLFCTNQVTAQNTTISTMHQVNMGRIGKTAPTFTSDEPLKMFQCCVTILDWQNNLKPQELCKYIFHLLAFRHSNDTPKIQWTNVMLSNFNCMFKNSFENLLCSCTV